MEHKEKQKYRNDPLGNKIKELEENTPSLLPPTNWIIMRIDGHCFSTFTRAFQKPCDPHLSKAMIKTSEDLCKEFHAITAYTQSDEITLLIPPTTQNEKGQYFPHIFNGKKQKLESLMSSFTSVRFNFHLNAMASDVLSSPRKHQAMISFKAYFDARAITVNNDQDVADIFLWRYKFDCYRNGLSALAHSVFGPRKLEQKNTQQKLEMLAEKNVDLGQYPLHLFFGTFIKKSLVEKECENKKTHMMEKCQRTEYVSIHLPFEKYTKEKNREQEQENFVCFQYMLFTTSLILQ